MGLPCLVPGGHTETEVDLFGEGFTHIYMEFGIVKELGYRLGAFTERLQQALTGPECSFQGSGVTLSPSFVSMGFRLGQFR